MNRSILIVICDFLLLSLLTFSTDLSRIVGQDEGVATVKADVVLRGPESSGKELVAVMKQALADEQGMREGLQAELTQYRETERQHGAQVAQQAEERTRQVQQLQQLQQKQADLEKQYAAALANIQALTQKLQSNYNDASLTREKLAAKEAELQKQKALAGSLQQQIEMLSGRLQSAESDKQLASGQIAMMQQQMQVEQAQNARLSESYRALATNATAFNQGSPDNNGLAPGILFDEFVRNRVQANFNAYRTGLLGVDINRTKTSKTILATDGANTYALCHVEDTPLTLAQSGTDWQRLTGILSRNQVQVPIRLLSFHVQDPRVVFVPITKAEAAELGCKVFPIASDPYKFQNAVLIGSQESYFGQCTFQMDLTMPEYARLIRDTALYGKFNPSRGDLVFSCSGELLGVMANDTYCLVMHEFAESEALTFGPAPQATRTGELLSRMYYYADQLPSKLQ